MNFVNFINFINLRDFKNFMYFRNFMNFECFMNFIFKVLLIYFLLIYDFKNFSLYFDKLEYFRIYYVNFDIKIINFYKIHGLIWPHFYLVDIIILFQDIFQKGRGLNLQHVL